MRLRSLLIGWVALVGCTEASDPGGGAAGYEREVHGGDRHDQVVDGIARDRVDLDRVVASAAPLRDVLGDLDGRDFTTTVHAMPTAGAGTLTTVFAQQVVDGVPVRGAYVYLASRRGGDGDRLLASSYHLYQGPKLAMTPTVARPAAERDARDHLRVAPTASVTGGLAIWPIDGALQLVWELAADGAELRALVIASGPRAGRVEVIDERVFETVGRVAGWVAVGGAPGGRGRATELPLPSTQVAAGAAATATGADGRYQLMAADGATVTTRLAGPAAVVADLAGPVLTASAPAAPTVDLTLGLETGEATLAQATAFYFTTRAWQFLGDHGIAPSQLGAPLAVNVNLGSTCNAYFSPPARTINFFRSGGGCKNSAEATIIAHEYGHFVDHTFGGITNGGLSEGWGDVLACLQFQGPVVGGDLFAGDRMIRTCDNAYRYPAGGFDEVHALGQAWAGFVWHARAGLIAAEGEAAGDARIRALVLPSLPSNAPRIPEAVREVFLRDDDDDDLGNGTPHYDLLYAAAERHGLGFVVVRDPAPPGAVADLTSTAATPTSVALAWTAPGDDGANGTAARYDLRWSTAPITEAGFASATPAPAPTPIGAGGRQAATIEVPPVGTVYVAIKATDELGKTATMSNLVTVALPEPAVVFEDGAEAGLGNWTADGLWHVTARRAGAGAAAFWYGDETSGDYDRGAPHRGALTSPVIDLAGVAEPRLAYDELVDVETAADRDLVRVEVVDVDDPAVVIAVDKRTGSTAGQFATRLVALEGLAGRRVRVRFTFDTVDANANRGLGWLVDRVRVFGDRAAPPPPSGLLINEVLADPPVDYDANRDGMYSIRGDELVELVNTGAAALDLGGVTLADAVAVRVTFAPGTTLAPGQALVVFGGSAPPMPGVVTVATAGLYLNNGGDQLFVRRADGELLAEFRYGAEGGRDQALVHQVDGDATSPIVGHRTVASTPASPGRRSDGTPFGDEPPRAGRLAINEVLADPAAGFDANGDGVASVVDDEFVELINAGATALDLSGASVADATQVRGRFGAGTTLAPGAVLVVFGGGAPALPGVATAVMGPLQLNNSGDRVTIRDASGLVLAELEFGATAGMDQSLVRAIDGDPDATMVMHRTLSPLPASPGRRTDGQGW